MTLSAPLHINLIFFVRTSRTITLILLRVELNSLIASNALPNQKNDVANMSPQEKLQQILLLLNKKREEIEQEIAGINDYLLSPQPSGAVPGLKGGLIDSEGFPRADLDIHQIRIPSTAAMIANQLGEQHAEETTQRQAGQIFIKVAGGEAQGPSSLSCRY